MTRLPRSSRPAPTTVMPGPGDAGAPSVLFYTPLKHPMETEASGDREIARSLLRALAAIGLAPELASRFLTWRRSFDAAEAVRLERIAAIRATTLIARVRRRPAGLRPRLWLTYQNYYRCPDLLGPAVATALEIPYVLVDTAVSAKSRGTAFRPWVSAARVALRRADLVFATSPRDLPRLAAFQPAGRRDGWLRLLPTAVDTRRFAQGAATRACRRAALRARLGGGDAPVILAVGMMRTHDKLDSYRLLAAALERLHAQAPEQSWRLVTVGDGPARPAVEAALAGLPPGRVHCLGAMPPGELPELYGGADLFAFPGLGEALGLVYLEAQAAGLPVVACHGPGPDVMVAPQGGLLCAPSPDAYAASLRALLADPPRARAMGVEAQRFVVTERSLSMLERELRQGLALLGVSASPLRPAPDDPA